MKISFRPIHWLTLSFLACLSSVTAKENTPVSVFENNQPGIFLVPPDSKNPILRAALKDFAQYYQQMTGVSLPNDSGGTRIPLKFAIQNSTGETPTPEQVENWSNFTIAVNQDGIVITSYSSLGAANGLYTLLDKWGCRWIMPGAIGECIPKVKELSLPTGSINGKLSSDFRLTRSASPEFGEWQRRNRNSFERWITSQHYWNYIIPEKIYFDPQKPDTYHPEYYALIGGQRSTSQICTSNPEVIKIAIETAKQFFKDHPTVDSFPIDPNDNLDFCQCEACLRQDPPGTTPEGLPLMTDRVVLFANKVAEGIRDEYPGKKVGFHAYMNHSLPPERVKPGPEILVNVTRSNYDLLRLCPRESGDSASQFYHLIEQWKKLTPNISTYEYNPIYWNANLLCPNFLEWGKTIQDTLRLGSTGTYTDGLIGADNTANFLNFYLLFRISADATRDPEQELRDVCERFYGPAAAPMLAYYMTLSKVTDHRAPGVFGGGLRHYHEMFIPEMIATSRKHLEEARKAVSNDVFAERIALADLNQQYLEAYLEGVWSAQSGDYSKSVAAFDRATSLVTALGERGILHQKNIFGTKDTLLRLDGIRLMTLAQYFPDEFGMIRRWMLLGPLDNSSRGAELSTDRFQPILSIDAPVKLEDGSILKWRKYENPSGFLDFRKALGPINPKWTALYAYVGFRVVMPEKKRVELRMDSFNAFRVYINGKEVFYRPGWDLDIPDKRKVPVILDAGENTIVVKCTHTSDTYSFPWGLWFRMTDRAGQPLKNLEFYP